ncbi:hypothetical protein [Pelagovum pacificum]|uniref:hypothetical protein n=1 Tax=Pelagovum pacificum TaxID=2588711 RepID=UPI0011222BCA|nr:hypothetical protein [Pelagovum pacificum]QQA42990.1 hypothetical protein I8N54_19845 [Pelagovum pacificum]
MTDNTISLLTELLRKERTAILSGDFSELALIAEQKRLHLERLARNQVAESSLTALEEKAEQNATLLRSAMNGVSAAKRRLEEVRRVRNGPLFYAPAGNTEVRFTTSSHFRKKV